jgi:HEAT repeat protein
MLASDLVSQLGDSTPAIRLTARDALKSMEADYSESLIESLIAGMSDHNPHIRAGCADLMDHLGDDCCVLPLTNALTDPLARVRRHAVHSLSCQPCKSSPLQADIVALLIERALTDTSIRVRRVSVHQLGLQPFDPRAITALEQILATNNDEKLRSRAKFALQNQLCNRIST